MKSSAQPSDDSEPWDDLRSCREPSEEEWTRFLFGKRSGPRSANHPTVDFAARMTATTFNALNTLGHSFCMEDAWSFTFEHYSRRFKKLLKARKAEFNCLNFESLYRKDLRRFVRTLGYREIARRRKFLSVSPLSRGEEESGPTLDTLAGAAPSPLGDTEKVEIRSLFDRARADLPRQDRKIYPMFLPEPGASAPRRAPAQSEAKRQAASRAAKRFEALCRVHRETESEEGRLRILQAIFVCLADHQDSEFVEAHLFGGKSLAALKRARESVDAVRFRFLRCIAHILPVIDPERVRAMDLLPERHRAPLAAVFFKLQPLEEVARAMGWERLEASIHLREALADLRVLHAACVSCRSPKGRAELEKLADSLARPGSVLIRRVLLGREAIEVVAPQFGLTAEEAREALLKSLK